jgi:hypothetical protein
MLRTLSRRREGLRSYEFFGYFASQVCNCGMSLPPIPFLRLASQPTSFIGSGRAWFVDKYSAINTAEKSNFWHISRPV